MAYGADNDGGRGGAKGTVTQRADRRAPLHPSLPRLREGFRGGGGGAVVRVMKGCGRAHRVSGNRGRMANPTEARPNRIGAATES